LSASFRVYGKAFVNKISKNFIHNKKFFVYKYFLKPFDRIGVLVRRKSFFYILFIPDKFIFYS